MLARTIAHDLNNPLMLLADYDFGDPQNSLVSGEEARLSLCRLSWLVSALGAYSGDSDDPGASCRLADCLDLLAQVARAMSDIPFQLNVAPGLESIEVAASRSVFCGAIYLLLADASRRISPGIELGVELAALGGNGPRLACTVTPLPPAWADPSAEIENLPPVGARLPHYRIGALHAAVLAATSGGSAAEFEHVAGTSQGVRLYWRLADAAQAARKTTDSAALLAPPVCVTGGETFAADIAKHLAEGTTCHLVQGLDEAAGCFEQHGAGTLFVDGDRVAPSSYELARLRWMIVNRVHRLWVVFSGSWPPEWEVLHEEYPQQASPLVRNADLGPLLRAASKSGSTIPSPRRNRK